MKLACIFGHWRRPGVLSASVGLLTKHRVWQWLWYTASEATRSPQIDDLFPTSEAKVSFLSSHIFRVLSINKTDSFFPPTRRDSGCRSGCSLSKQTFLSLKKESVFHWNVGWISLGLLEDLTRIKIEFLQ